MEILKKINLSKDKYTKKIIVLTKRYSSNFLKLIDLKVTVKCIVRIGIIILCYGICIVEQFIVSVNCCLVHLGKSNVNFPCHFFAFLLIIFGLT